MQGVVIEAGQLQTSLGASLLAPMQKSKAGGQKIGVRLVGQGTVGAVTLEPSSIDFGTVAVGFPAVCDITLLNQSGGNLCYSITCTAVPMREAVPSLSAAESSPDANGSLAQLTEQMDSAQSAEVEDDGSALHLVVEDPQGFLPARATKTLRLTLNPSRRKQYRLQLVCQTATAQSSSTALSTAPLPANLSSPPVCAGIEAFSTYPTVMITDIACQGLDKPFVWNQMSCSQINTQLAAEMTEVWELLHHACMHEMNWSLLQQLQPLAVLSVTVCMVFCQLLQAGHRSQTTLAIDQHDLQRLCMALQLKHIILRISTRHVNRRKAHVIKTCFTVRKCPFV